MVLLPLQDDVACVEQFDLGGAFEPSTTDLGDLGEALDHLPIVAAVENLVDQLQHVDAVPLQEVVDVGAQQLLKARQRVQIGDGNYVAIFARGRRLNFLLDQPQDAVDVS